MENPAVFQKTLADFERAYVAYEMLEGGEAPVRELRNAIQMKLNQLQEAVTNESREVASFSTEMPISQDATVAIAKEARSLKTGVIQSYDEAERARGMLAGPMPPPNYGPLLWKLGGIGAVLVVLSFMGRRSAYY